MHTKQPEQKMNSYSITTKAEVTTVKDKETCEVLTQYRDVSASALRREIKKHLEKPGATLSNYQW